MAILNNNFNYKFLTPEQLSKVITQVPTDSHILVNSVGNLCVCDQNQEYIGYIDFLNDGEFIPNDD